MVCPYIPVISYTDWCGRVYEKAENARIPLNGILELTYRCSLKCVHCYVIGHPVKRELTYEEICLVIDQIAEAGCLFLLLTGGEPLIRKDFLDIYLYAKRKGMLVTVFTNGTLLTPEIADYFVKYPPFTVEITLYGVTEEVNTRVTQVAGSLEKVLNGIHLLFERNIPFKLKTMVMTLNKHELGVIKEFAEKLEVDFRFDFCINPRLDGSKNPCQLRITPQEIVKYDVSDEKRAKEWRQVCKNYWGKPALKERCQCAAGVTYFVVNPAGELKMCSLLPAMYEIKSNCKDSFLNGWNNTAPLILAEERNPDSRCNSCEIFSICDRCMANSLLETGNPDSPVTFFCKIAHLRAEAFCDEERRSRLKKKGEFIYGEEKKELQKAVISKS